jgi:hypothetical protein
VHHPWRDLSASVYPVLVPPLVALVLFGFLFLIALCLTVWAALTMGDQTRRYDPETARRGAGGGRVSYVPMAPTKPLVWRGGTQPRPSATTAAHGADDRPRPTVSNDDYRGAKAVVTPRPVTEDAFERFIENEKDNRR